MIVTLQGGLGNQMFQYAFGASVSKVREENLLFTRYRVDEDHKRSYSLGAYNCELAFAPKETVPNFTEDVFQFDPTVYTKPRGSSFSGHWQTEKYFIPEIVRKDLTLRNKPSDQSMAVADQISKAEQSAFIHVRRGDYLWAENVIYHGCASPKYYDNAIARIRASYPGVKFFVFSDEPDWCKTAYPDFTVVDHNKAGDRSAPGQEHEDIWLMSLCKHAVIVNSSFSWWGAWLGDTQPNRIVVAPSRWFVVNLASKDIVPERWIKYDI